MLDGDTQQGYGGGNTANLLVLLNGHVRGKDCSQLTIWQANLRGVEAQDTSFAASDLAGSVFTETASNITAAAFSPDRQYIAGSSIAGDLRLWRATDRVLVNRLWPSWAASQWGSSRSNAVTDMKTLAAFSLCGLLNVLYASFSIIAPNTLNHIDPLVFTTLQLLLLTPLAGFVVWYWRASINRTIIVYSLSMGSCLAAGFLMIALALRDVGITESTILSCVNGVLAALVGWRIFHQRLNALTWLACGCAIAGAACIGASVPLRWQGDLIAFLGGSLFTLATFLWEQFIGLQQRQAHIFWPVMACQFFTMAGIVFLLALCFGNWQTLALWHPTDTLTLLYCSVGATLAPTLLSSWIQLRQFASAVTIAFFAVLDPLMSAAFAFGVTGERLPWLAYVGGIGVLVSMLLQALAAMSPSAVGNQQADQLAPTLPYEMRLEPTTTSHPYAFKHAPPGASASRSFECKAISVKEGYMDTYPGISSSSSLSTGPFSLLGPMSSMSEEQLNISDSPILAAFEEAPFWGMEMMLDLFDCDPSLIRNAAHIQNFVIDLCEQIHMRRYGDPLLVHFGDEPRVQGYSLVQLIETSNINAHFIEEQNSVCLNIFSCSPYPPYRTAALCQRWFGACGLYLTVQFRGAQRRPQS